MEEIIKLDSVPEILPNGETFEIFSRRNIDWWRGAPQNLRKTYYINFFANLNIKPEMFDNLILGEVGAGPYGGIIEILELKASKKYFIDILQNEFVKLNFMNFSDNSICVTSPMEDIPLPDKCIDVLFSYNALDHGWDIKKAILEINRISKKFYVAFDCKTNKPQHDQLDHYQDVNFANMAGFCRDYKFSYGKLYSNKIPNFEFEHNWGFPIMYVES